MSQREESTPSTSRSRSSGPEYVRADAPIESRAEDRLRRAPLADGIADQVIHGPPDQGLVIAVVGEWGSGKTSVLKMVEEAVGEKDGSVILVFNPWLFSGADQLVLRFLDELAARLREAGGRPGASKRLGQAAARVSSYAQSLEPLSWLPVVGVWLARLGGAGRMLKTIREARAAQPSAEEQRELVRKELRGLEQRVLVVIDDLDRIESSQIRDMIRLVKLVGDFPNVTYLLSYDREPVERAVGSTPREGAEYLEKIVQVVHNVPEPPPEAVSEILLEELNGVVNVIATGPFSERDWQNVFPGGVRPFFRTLRDVRRYLNALPVSLRVIGEEVALVDVLALEAVRIFVPTAYEQLSACAATLTSGDDDFGDESQRQAADTARVEGILAAAGDLREPTAEVLRRLFPNIGHLLGGTRLTGGGQRARRELRVAHPDIFRMYLQRTLPAGVVSSSLVTTAIDALDDGKALEGVFASIDADTVERLIQRLEDYEHDFDPAAVEPAVPVLLNQLPRLREGTRGMMDFGVELVVIRVVLRLFRSLDDEAERLRIVEGVLPDIQQLSGRLELIDCVGHRENVGHGLVGEEGASRLYEELRGQVLAASPQQLSEERDPVQLFLRIAEGGDIEGLEKVREACRDDAVLLNLLRAGLSERRSQGMGEFAVRSRPSLPWSLLVKWLGDDQLQQRVNELVAREDATSLPGRTRTALQTAQKYASGEFSDDDRW